MNSIAILTLAAPSAQVHSTSHFLPPLIHQSYAGWLILPIPILKQNGVSFSPWCEFKIYDVVA